MRHDFAMSFIPDVTILDVVPQLLDMVESLFTDENTPSLETNLAECFFMVAFQMSLQ